MKIKQQICKKKQKKLAKKNKKVKYLKKNYCNKMNI